MAERPALVAVGAAVLAALVTWLGCAVLLRAGGTLPTLGASAWLPLLLLAAGTAWLARTMRRAARDPQRRPDADVALTRVRIGAASVVAGGLVAGCYATLAGYGLAGWPAPLAVDRAGHGGIAALVGLGWAVAGIGVLRGARVPPPS